VKRGPTLPVAKVDGPVRTLRPPPYDRVALRATTVTYRDADDQIVTVERTAIRNAIVLALADGPRHKWQLREGLHVPEQVILRELHVLRDDGAVKPIGKRFTDRKWALASWRPPAGQAPVYPNSETAIRSKKPEPTRESWWTRPEFRYAGKGADV
jgi:hypothetical protein